MGIHLDYEYLSSQQLKGEEKGSWCFYFILTEATLLNSESMARLDSIPSISYSFQDAALMPWEGRGCKLL